MISLEANPEASIKQAQTCTCSFGVPLQPQTKLPSPTKTNTHTHKRRCKCPFQSPKKSGNWASNLTKAPCDFEPLSSRIDAKIPHRRRAGPWPAKTCSWPRTGPQRPRRPRLSRALRSRVLRSVSFCFSFSRETCARSGGGG